MGNAPPADVEKPGTPLAAAVPQPPRVRITAMAKGARADNLDFFTGTTAFAAALIPIVGLESGASRGPIRSPGYGNAGPPVFSTAELPRSA